MSKTIGFFGDSFCSQQYNDHSIQNGYVSYMEMLSKHFDAKIVNIGKGGCGVYDTILIQLKPFMLSNTVPDICIFVWSHPGRLFNRSVRRITSKSVQTYQPSLLDVFEQKIWKAAKLYYEHLFDYEKEDFEHLCVLNYVDNVLLKQLPSSTNIVHLWSFGNPDWSNKDFRPSVTSYPHTFKTGVEIRPALSSVSLYDSDQSMLHYDPRCNHLDGQFKNDLVFEWIKEAIEGNSHSLDYSEKVEPLFNIYV